MEAEKNIGMATEYCNNPDARMAHRKMAASGRHTTVPGNSLGRMQKCQKLWQQQQWWPTMVLSDDTGTMVTATLM